MDASLTLHALLPALRRLARDCCANTTIVFALTTPVIVGGAGMAVDYAMAAREHTSMQAAADGAALASAREIQMAQSDASRVTAVATSYALSAIPDAAISTNVDLTAGTVQVTLQKDLPRSFGGLLSRTPTHIAVNATAQLQGGMPLCLLGLDPKANGTITLDQSAQMTAPGCMVYSNSTSPQSIKSKNDAVLHAGFICSAGGKVKTKQTNFNPDPMTDCPALADPLASRQPPSVGACNYNNVVVDGGAALLMPGVYCGGLTLTDGAQVTLSPGIYVVKNGPLLVTGGASISGTEVGIYLSGSGSTLTFDTQSTVNLSAPKTGSMAGLLIFDDPNSTGKQHQILSNNARTLLGTIYMPQAQVVIQASAPIADKSAYTVLVVRQINLYAGPNLYLNTDYGASDVPVPNGVGPYGGTVSLTN